MHGPTIAGALALGTLLLAPAAASAATPADIARGYAE